jgi:uncharacterized protein YegL
MAAGNERDNDVVKKTERNKEVGTLLCVILDRSGSMSGKEGDVIGGVNAFIAEQKKVPNDDALIALVRFDQEYEIFRKVEPLAYTAPITADDYKPRGSTALLDAIGNALSMLDVVWATERPQRCIVVIVTDGQENASVEFTKPQIKRMIEAREGTGKWSFIYLGADINAFAEASAMGINVANTARYVNTSVGTQSVYTAASNAVGTMRATGSTVAHNLGGDLPEDVKPQQAPQASDVSQR